MINNIRKIYQRKFDDIIIKINDPNYHKRLTLMFELKDSNYINNLSNNELNYIYEIYQKQMDKLKEQTNNNKIDYMKD